MINPDIELIEWFKFLLAPKDYSCLFKFTCVGISFVTHTHTCSCYPLVHEQELKSRSFSCCQLYFSHGVIISSTFPKCSRELLRSCSPACCQFGSNKFFFLNFIILLFLFCFLLLLLFFLIFRIFFIFHKPLCRELTFSRSQRGNCSATYEIPAQKQVVYQWSSARFRKGAASFLATLNSYEKNFKKCSSCHLPYP